MQESTTTPTLLETTVKNKGWQRMNEFNKENYALGYKNVKAMQANYFELVKSTYFYKRFLEHFQQNISNHFANYTIGLCAFFLLWCLFTNAFYLADNTFFTSLFSDVVDLSFVDLFDKYKSNGRVTFFIFYTLVFCLFGFIFIKKIKKVKKSLIEEQDLNLIQLYLNEVREDGVSIYFPFSGTGLENSGCGKDIEKEIEVIQTYLKQHLDNKKSFEQPNYHDFVLFLQKQITELASKTKREEDRYARFFKEVAKDKDFVAFIQKERLIESKAYSLLMGNVNKGKNSTETI